VTCGDCSVDPRTHDGCAHVEVVEHVLENVMLEVALRRTIDSGFVPVCTRHI
jgi:hypothetical protein